MQIATVNINASYVASNRNRIDRVGKCYGGKREMQSFFYKRLKYFVLFFCEKKIYICVFVQKNIILCILLIKLFCLLKIYMNNIICGSFIWLIRNQRSYSLNEKRYSNLPFPFFIQLWNVNSISINHAIYVTCNLSKWFYQIMVFPLSAEDHQYAGKNNQQQKKMQNGNSFFAFQ